jgi:hypothetical protein
MRRSPQAGALGLAFLVTTSCTLVSGVDELELRKNGQGSSGGAADASAPTEPPEGALPSGSPGSSGSSGGSTAGGAGASCGAAGSWTACLVLQPFSTCSDYCKSVGRACVESCCATDNQGAFPAKVGLAYAAGPTCSGASLPSGGSFGLCTDPLLFGTDALQARCCCR